METTGAGTTVVMSQKAVTEAIGTPNSPLASTNGGTGVSNPFKIILRTSTAQTKNKSGESITITAPESFKYVFIQVYSANIICATTNGLGHTLLDKSSYDVEHTTDSAPRVKIHTIPYEYPGCGSAKYDVAFLAVFIGLK